MLCCAADTQASHSVSTHTVDYSSGYSTPYGTVAWLTANAVEGKVRQALSTGAALSAAILRAALQ